MRFVGRSRQLEQLDGWFDRVARERQGLLLAVRGRRQVGKSRLFTEFVERERVPHVFFTAIKDASRPAQLEAFRRNVHEATTPIVEADVLFASDPGSWSDAFGRLRLAAQQQPVVVVLDEFPWAVQTTPSLEGELQVAWDRDLQHLPILLALVGSDLAMMERVTRHDRPLFGRAREVVINPFDTAEVADALGPRGAAFDAFDARLVTGGYPKLVDDLVRAGSLERFVADGVADENTNLMVMAQRSMSAEFPTEAQARQVLAAIGGQEVGHATFSSVVGRLADDGSAPGTALSRALKILAGDKGLVSIETPAGQSAVSRLRRYRINDTYLRFWFRFLEPQVMNISRGRSDLALAAFRSGWESWRGLAIEPVVQEAVLRLAPELRGLDRVSSVGAWWNRDHSVQVDLVAANGKSVQAIGTIKWRARRKLQADELRALAAARAVIPGAGDAVLIAVCPAGLRDGVAPDVALDAERLLGAWQR